jgi:hypothetical protein
MRDLWWAKWHWSGFFRVLWLPLPILIPPTVDTHHVSSWAGTISQIVADVPNGFSLTPPQEAKKIIKHQILQGKDQHRSNASTIFLSSRGHGSDFSRILAILRAIFMEPLSRKPFWYTGHSRYLPHLSQFIIQPFYNLHFMAHIYTKCLK